MITYKLRIDLQSERELYSDIVFTTGDKSGYVLELSFFDNGARMDLTDCALTVKTRRADGAVVIDGGTIADGAAHYTVADNAYETAGEVAMEAALVRTDGSYVTTKVIYALVREGFGESGLTSSDNEPILAQLTAQTLAIRGEVNELQTDLSAHKTNEKVHEEAFKSERARFNPLYTNALKGTAEGSNITINDAVDGTPLSLTLYGRCTETLADSSAEKSPDNPADITGVGEVGDVTVTVTGADGNAQIITIPLENPLYGIKHPTTGKRLVSDEIKAENGRVTIVRNISIHTITGSEEYIFAFRAAGAKTYIYVSGFKNTPGAADPLRLAVLSPQFKTGISSNLNAQDLLLGYPGGYGGYIQILFDNTILGVESAATDDERKAAFVAWVQEYNQTSSIPLTVYAIQNRAETDITDTAAGQALLALIAQNGVTITNSEGAEMKAEYNRDINKAFEEIQNSIVALGGTI